MAADLLPPNATALERALSIGAGGVSQIPVALEDLWNPATCPIDLLPWLAWALSIDRWDVTWADAEKREAVAQAIALQRRKGTRASVEAVLAAFDDLLELVEWFESGGDPHTFPPHTFEVRLLLIDADGVAGGRRITRAFAGAIIAEVSKAKPVRAHFTLVQRLELVGLPTPIAAAQAASYRRLDLADTPADASWSDFIQTEDGEPLQDDAGGFIDGTAA